jgi:hypothetical protein
MSKSKSQSKSQQQQDPYEEDYRLLRKGPEAKTEDIESFRKLAQCQDCKAFLDTSLPCHRNFWTMMVAMTSLFLLLLSIHSFALLLTSSVALLLLSLSRSLCCLLLFSSTCLPVCLSACLSVCCSPKVQALCHRF